MEWWEMQDELEAKGWKFIHGMLKWPNGKFTPLPSTSLTPEGCVIHAYHFVKSIESTSAQFKTGGTRP